MNEQREPDSDRDEAIRKLGGLIEDVEIAMLATVAADGRLVSRPMVTQKVEFNGDLWFAIDCDSGAAAEIAANPQVNVAYAAPASNIYVSVAGRASLVRERARIEALWSPDLRLYFHGGIDDPSLCLVRVEAESAEYWDSHGKLLGRALDLMRGARGDHPGSRVADNVRIDLQ